MNKNNSGIIKIAIFGGSSQVGASLALYFKKYNLAEPVCFLRSTYGKPFFDLTNIRTELFDIYGSELQNKLSGYDVVIDCTFPGGHTFEIPKKIKTTTAHIIKNMPKNGVFIYMSSIMAFGMPDLLGRVEHYKLPRGTYGYIKRKAEKYVRYYGNKAGIKVYNFRLGQVHGFLQSVNGSYRKQFKENNTLHLNANANDYTNTIFISTLGNAILKCAKNSINPGTYTLVSHPQWTIKSLYEYYKTYYHFDNSLKFHPVKRQSIKSKLLAKILNTGKALKPLIDSYLLMRQPNLSIRLKGKYRRMETRNQIVTEEYSPADYHILGQLKYKQIQDINSSIEAVLQVEKEMESWYESLIEQQKNEQ